MLLESLFFEIGAVIIVAAVLSYVVHLLRQPLLIAYILTGILVGPGVLGLTKSSEVFHSLSQIGIAFLLFTVGLGLNWRRVKEVGPVALLSGVAQVIVTTFGGFLLGLWTGFDLPTSLLVGLAFSFSSTIIIVKLLQDKEDADTLYGKISIAFLLVQDIIAMMILLALSALKDGGALSQVLTVSLAKGVLVLLVFWVLSTTIVPPLVRYAAKSQELLLLFALGWCFAVAGVLVSFGFGIEIGALIAGVSLSGTMYEREINARIRTLRDFFLIIFFIVLGLQLPLGGAESLVLPIIAFTAYVLIGNPIIMLLVMRLLGYHPQTGFMVGTIVAQVSEFSFIMLSAGVAAGYVQDEALTLAAVVGLITMGTSTYFVKYNEELYERFRPWLRWLEPSRALHQAQTGRLAAPQVILFGYHRMGEVLLDEIVQLGSKHLVVDFDPLAIDQLAARGTPAVYGDASDEEFLSDLKAERAKLIISTIPDATVSLELLTYLRAKGFTGVAIVTVRTLAEAASCYEVGATYVIVPSVLGAERFRELLRSNRGGRKRWQQCVPEICRPA